MNMHRFLVATFVAIACGAPASAQRPEERVATRPAPCPVWSPIPGGSSFPRDSARSRCALDRVPVLREGEPLPPPPWVGRHASDDLQVIVNADGTVDSALTRYWTVSSDVHFQRAALATIRRWRFEPGLRNGRPTRSGFRLVLEAPTRDDTIPARLVWAWNRGGGADTLAGRWERLPSPTPLTAAQRDSVLVAMLHRLVQMRTLTPARDRAICVVSALGAAGDDAARALVVHSLHDRSSPRFSVAPMGCERSPRAQRLVIPRVHLTEDGRAVMYPSGDYLARWPGGLDGTTWRAWAGRCVARLAGDVVSAAECDVRPDMQGEEAARRHDASYGRSWFYAGMTRHGRPRHADSIDVRLRVTTAGAWGEDTVIVRVGRPWSLRERAVLDSVPPCGGWTAHSSQGSAIAVVHGDIDGRSLQVTAARGDPAIQPPPSEGCHPQEPHMARFAAFLLGGIGEPATAPVSLCFHGRGGCYALDPRRHRAADAPHARFRMADLRADTRMGGNLDFELRVDGAPEDLLPVIIIRHGAGRHSAWIASRVALDRWDFGVMGYDNLGPDAEVLIYLVRK